MLKELEKLTIEERELLFKAPVLLSVFAACTNKGINRVQKADAIKLAHLKPFTADPALISFYQEAEKNFEQQFDLISKKYRPFEESGCDPLKQEIKNIYPILKKLDRDYASKLMRSFEKYERHVRKAAHNIVEDFIFPVPIPGINA